MISGSKAEDGSYLPEPPEIMSKMMSNQAGLNQLAQAVLDARAQRRMSLVPEGEMAEDSVRDDWDTLSPRHVIAFARGGSWNAGGEDHLDPRHRFEVLMSQVKAKTIELGKIIDDASGVTTSAGAVLVDVEGAMMKEEYESLINLSFVLRKWTETSTQLRGAAEAAHDEDTEFSDVDWDESDD